MHMKTDSGTTKWIILLAMVIKISGDWLIHPGHRPNLAPRVLVTLVQR